jgi:hypothetical protein
MTMSPRVRIARPARCLLSAGAALLCLTMALGCANNDVHPSTSRSTAHALGIINGTLILEYSYSSGGSVLGGAVLNEPGRARLEIVSAGKVVGRLLTGTSGAFRFRIPAGRYQFHLEGSRRPCATDTPPAPVTFTVRANRANQVQVVCAAGRLAN